jgi:hypothetical protein
VRYLPVNFILLDLIVLIMFGEARALNSVGPGFVPRFGDRLSWLRFFVVFLSPSTQNRG